MRGPRTGPRTRPGRGHSFRRSDGSLTPPGRSRPFPEHAVILRGLRRLDPEGDARLQIRRPAEHLLDLVGREALIGLSAPDRNEEEERPEEHPEAGHLLDQLGSSSTVWRQTVVLIWSPSPSARARSMIRSVLR